MNKLYKILSSIYYYIFFAVILAFIAVLAVYFVNSPVTDLSKTEIVYFNDGWTYIDSNGTIEDLELPVSFNTEDTTSYYTNTLPNEIKFDQNLLINTYHQNIKVYVDDILIYSNKTEYLEGLLPMTGNSLNFVSLSPDYAGATIKIELTTNNSKYKGSLNEILLGSKYSIFLHLLSENIFSFVSLVILFSIMFFLIILAFVFKKADFWPNIMCILLFSLLLFMYSLPELDVFQFIMPRTGFTNMVSFETLMIMPLPLLIYFYNLNKNINPIQERVYLFSIYINVILFIVNNALHLTNTVLLPTTFKFTLFVLLYEIVLAIFQTAIDAKNNKSKFLSIVFILMGLLMAIDLIRYNYTTGNYDAALFSRFGLDLYTLAISTTLIKNTVDLSILGKQAYTYEQMAMHDPLTGVGSRVAYEEKQQHVEKHNELKNSCIIMVVDLNDLKKVNDVYGHEAGDDYITSCVSIIKNSFDGIADIFRTGGDEFVVMSTERGMFEFEYCVNSMKDSIYRYNKTHEMKLSFAYGYNKYDKSRDHNLLELYKRSDKDMYQMKFVTKQRRNANAS